MAVPGFREKQSANRLVMGLMFRFHGLWRILSAALSIGLASLLTLVLLSGSTASVMGQIPIPSPSAVQNNSKPPDGVERFGAIEVAPVIFEGEELFKLASPTVRNRSNPGDQTPVEVRAEQIQSNLKLIISLNQPEEVVKQRGYFTNFDPKTLQVFTATLQEQTVIVAKDDYRSRLQELVTVTTPDANYHGVSINELAQRWQAILYKNLSEELKERLPETVDKRIQQALLIALAAVGVSVLFWILQRLLLVRDNVLQQREAVEMAEASPPTETSDPQPAAIAPLASDRIEFLGTLRRQFTLKRRRKVIAAVRWLLGWGQIAVWLLGTALILERFPETRQVGLALLGIPIKLLLIWFAAGLLNWAADLLIDRFSHAWQDNQFSAFQFFVFEDAQRKSLRISTTLRALRGLKTFLVWCFGITWALQEIGVPIASVLAGGAIIAFAISLGFQNLVRDLVNGCLILWEDQYGIGDVVSIGGTTGFVENMNLRITQLRDAEGRLITIPNSSIIKVENLTRTWSRVDFSIEIDYDSDLDKALAVITEVAEQLYTEPEWRDRILDPPEILGVDQLSNTGMLIRVWIKTKPLQQWVVGREFRRRIRHALNEHNIRIGIPQQSLRYEDGRHADADIRLKG
ncbi:MAG: mechanosensitive ion channel family protein [Leptolyngbyaceae cyanobacterium RU_5_1]|nr:mechanosensitive ion channel family protein [Leptolyngbyaceae cyanobacterium RU_5_1]